MVGAELKIFENLESQDRRKWRFQSLLYLLRHEEFPSSFSSVFVSEEMYWVL